jgi:hypothetical protein
VIASRRVPAFLLALACIAANNAAWAESADPLTIDLGGHRILLPIPEDYCPLDPAEDVDAEIDAHLRRVMESGGHYLGAAIDCGELDALRDRSTSLFSRYLVYIAEKSDSGNPAVHSGLGRAEFIGQAVASFPDIDTDAISAQSTETLQQTFDTDAIELDAFRQVSSAQDDNAFYFGFVIDVALANSVQREAGMIAGTLLHSLFISANLYRPLDDDYTMPALEADAKILAAALVAANPGSDPGRDASDSGDRLFGVDWRQVAIAGLRGATVGAVVGGIVWLFERLRRRRTDRRRFD